MFTIVNIALMNLLLSSDNVLIIALFGQHLRKKKRVLILLWSMLASVVLQLGILYIVAFLFRITVLQSLFGLIICYMAFHLLHKHEPKERATLNQATTLRSVSKIVVGNLMMSFENEATLISLSRGDVWLAWFGILITAPLVFFGSHLITWILQKYDFVLYIGSIILFKIGIDLMLKLPSLHMYLQAAPWVLTGLFGIYVAITFLSHKNIRILGQKLR